MPYPLNNYGNNYTYNSQNGYGGARQPNSSAMGDGSVQKFMESINNVVENANSLTQFPPGFLEAGYADHQAKIAQISGGAAKTLDPQAATTAENTSKQKAKQGFSLAGAIKIVGPIISELMKTKEKAEADKKTAADKAEADKKAAEEKVEKAKELAAQRQHELEVAKAGR